MIKDTIIYFLSRFLPAIVSFITLILFLNYLSPEAYGRYSLLILIVGITNLLSSQWIRSSMVRFYNEDNEYLNQVNLFQAIVIVLLIIIASIVLFSFDIEFKISLLFIGILINFIINEFFKSYFRIILKPKTVLIGNIFRIMFLLLALLTYIYYKNELVLSISLFSFLLGLIMSNIYFFMKKDSKFSFDYSVNTLKLFIVYGGPLTLAFALGSILQNIDKIIITLKIGIAYTGYYSMVFDLLHNSLFMIMGSLGLASLPRILKEDKFETQKKLFSKYVNLVYIVSLPILTMFIAVSPEISEIFNSFDYFTNKYIVSLIVLAAFINGINFNVYSQAVQLLKKTRLIIIPSLIAVVVSIVSNMILIDKIGLLGSALSSIFAFGTSNILIYLIYLKKSKINVIPNNLFFLFLSSLLCFSLTYRIIIPNVYLSIIVKCSLIIIMYVSLILIFRKKLLLNGVYKNG